MYEKYNAFKVGVGGGGGEYVPQIGFGWTNGVALVLLNTSFAMAESDSPGRHKFPSSTIYIVAVALSVVVCIGLMRYHRGRKDGVIRSAKAEFAVDDAVYIAIAEQDIVNDLSEPLVQAPETEAQLVIPITSDV